MSLHMWLYEAVDIIMQLRMVNAFVEYLCFVPTNHIQHLKPLVTLVLMLSIKPRENSLLHTLSRLSSHHVDLELLPVFQYIKNS